VVAVVAAVLVLGFAAFLVVKPDREACKTAIGAEVDTMLANDKPNDERENTNRRHAGEESDRLTPPSICRLPA